jgi:glucokinase
MTVLAVDVGGTKLAAAVWAGALGEVTRSPTGTDPWTALTELLDPLVAGVAGIGVGCGGPMAWPAGVVSPLNIPAWRGGFPLRDRLAERYGVPVRLHNDAACAAVGEHWQGGWGTDHLLGMVVSTGVGGGLVIGGRLVDGAGGNAGHVGHIVVDPLGPPCPCGGRGCLEAIARGPAIVAWAAGQGCTAGTGVELAELAAHGDRVALQAFAQAGRALGVGIASAAALLDVEVVAVGGGISQVPALWPTLRRTLREHARLSFLGELRVEPAALGPTAGLVGAAALLVAGDRYWSPSRAGAVEG